MGAVDRSEQRNTGIHKGALCEFPDIPVDGAFHFCGLSEIRQCKIQQEKAVGTIEIIVVFCRL